MPDTITLIDADGVSLPLTAGSFRVDANGPQGRFMPRSRAVVQTLAAQAGRRLRAVYHDSRVMTLPLVVLGGDERDCRDRARQLCEAIDPVRGYVRLRAMRDDGTAREAVCRYTGGLEGDESVESMGLRFARLRAALEFEADDPYWYDLDEQVKSFGTERVSVQFFDTQAPWTFVANELASGGVAINVSGSVEAWPRWTLSGPLTTAVLANDTTGRSLTITTVLAMGDEIEVDMRPGRKSIVGPAGNLWGSAVGEMWSMDPGINTVRVEFTGGSSSSRVTLRWQPRWLTA